jgi:hypothetical protein
MSTQSTNPSSSQLYDVPYLDDTGSNFQSWKYPTQTVLDVPGLSKTLDGTETDAVKIREARAQIILTLEDEPLSSVIGLNTAKEIWRKLCACYQGKGTQKVAYLIGELFQSSLVDTYALKPQINKIQSTAWSLKALSNEIKDNLIAIAIILSLPSSYSTLQTILMSLDN